MKKAAKKKATKNQAGKKKKTAQKTFLKDALLTETGLSLILPYDQVFDYVLKKMDYRFNVVAVLFLVEKRLAQQGIEIKISYETLGLCFAFLESSFPDGSEGFIEQLSNHLPDEWATPVADFLRQIRSETLKRIAPKIKKIVRSTASSTNTRKVRRLITRLNYIAWGRELPEPTKPKRGRPTKAKLKEKKAERKATSKKLFVRSPRKKVTRKDA